MLPPGFDKPSKSSNTPNIITKYFAFNGIGGISNIILSLGNNIPYANNKPYIAPEAPTVGIICSILNES